MKEKLKGFVMGVAATVIVGSGAAIAAGQFVSIDVIPNNINNFALNGEIVSSSSFTYNDSTYVQLRPIIEGLDGTVTYIDSTKSVICFNNWQRVPDPIYIDGLDKYYEYIIWDPDPWSATNDIQSYISLDVLYDLGFRYDDDSWDTTRIFRYYLP